MQSFLYAHILFYKNSTTTMCFTIFVGTTWYWVNESLDIYLPVFHLSTLLGQSVIQYWIVTEKNHLNKSFILQFYHHQFHMAVQFLGAILELQCFEKSSLLRNSCYVWRSIIVLGDPILSIAGIIGMTTKVIILSMYYE